MGIQKCVTSGKTSCMFKSLREVALFVHHSTIVRVVKLVAWDAQLERVSTVTPDMQPGLAPLGRLICSSGWTSNMVRWWPDYAASYIYLLLVHG